jgi:hypothetical protein
MYILKEKSLKNAQKPLSVIFRENKKVFSAQNKLYV